MQTRPVADDTRTGTRWSPDHPAARAWRWRGLGWRSDYRCYGWRVGVVYCPYCHECLGVGENAEDVLEEFHERCREMWQHDERLAGTIGMRPAQESPEYAAQVQRAVVISEDDVRLLSALRVVLNAQTQGPEPLTPDEERTFKLLDRLIGKR